MAARPRFDPKNDFVAARGFTFAGTKYVAGDPFDKTDVAAHKLGQVYGSRMINVAPTKVAEPAPDPVQLTALPGGYYHLKAPWIAEPEKLRGKVAAEKRLAEVRAEGEPASHHGVTVTTGDNGWFEVAAEWDPENIAKVHGEAAARELAALWREQGAPAPGPDLVTVDEGAIGTEAEGLFVVGAAWIADDDRELFTTKEEADVRAAALRAEGPPIDAVTVFENEGTWLVKAMWLESPETFDDEGPAQARGTELREAGPPEGWEPGTDD